MKRKILCALMLVSMLAMPVTAQATEVNASMGYEERDVLLGSGMVISDMIILSEDCVVNGDLYVNEGFLSLNGYHMQVNGNVYAKVDVGVDNGTLTVTGNYRQEEGCLTIHGGKAKIGGDLEVYKVDADGEKRTGDGMLWLSEESGRLEVAGDFLMDTEDIHGGRGYRGTITVKGDIIERNSGGFYPDKLVLAGSEEQTLQLTEESTIGNIKLENPKVKVAGYLNGTLGSDAKEITLDDGVLETNGLYLDGHVLNVPGDLVATGDVCVDKGILNVAGNHRQEDESLTIHSGKAVIGGDLQMYGIDADGEKETGNGELWISEENGSLTVDGDFLIDTVDIHEGRNIYGPIIVKGDIIENNSGGFHPFQLVLSGNEEQTLQLKEDSTIENIKLENPKVKVAGYLNGTLGSDAKEITLDDGVLETNGLYLDGHVLNVPGNMVANGEVNVKNSVLNVTGDYRQETADLNVDNGQVNIGGDLQIYSVNAEDENETGEGTMIISANGNLKIDGSLLINAIGYMQLGGKITIAKDLLVTASAPIDLTFNPSYVLLAGKGAQKVDLTKADALIDTLELGQEIGNYTFNPNPCWNNLIQVKNPFADVKESSWQYTFVKYALDNNLMSGKGKDESGNILFDPESSMTRAEFVQTLYNKEGKPTVTYSATFTDVPAGQWYTNAILWAAENNIVAGKGDKFDVGGKITRQEMATVLFKYANYSEYETSGRKDFAGFVDYDSISSWAINNMKWALHYGIMSGKGDKIDPIGNATRAECATMLRNFIKAYEE